MKPKLPPYEQGVLDRLEHNGNPLGWRPWKRNEEGVAIMRCELPVPGEPGWVRVTLCELRPEGMAYHPSVKMQVGT